jgi:hypothetical protein
MRHLAVFLGLSIIVFANSAQDLVNAKCTICHLGSQPTAAQRQNMIAPPMFGVMNNLGIHFNDDKKAITAFIKDYTINPSAKKAVCQSHAITRFGVMPSQKGNITPSELDKVANYLFDEYLKK